MAPAFTRPLIKNSEKKVIICPLEFTLWVCSVDSSNCPYSLTHEMYLPALQPLFSYLWNKTKYHWVVWRGIFRHLALWGKREETWSSEVWRSSLQRHSSWWAIWFSSPRSEWLWTKCQSEYVNVSILKAFFFFKSLILNFDSLTCTLLHQLVHSNNPSCSSTSTTSLWAFALVPSPC